MDLHQQDEPAQVADAEQRNAGGNLKLEEEPENATGNRNPQELFAEEPVFDGTEATVGAHDASDRGGWRPFGALEMATSGLDWTEKASALKNFVKDRGVEVSNALRKLSVKMEDLDREVFEKGFEYMALADRFRFREEPSANLSQEHATAETDVCSKIKGRIMFFSMSGCEDCRAVRRLLRKKGFPFVEINVDVYPHRKLELEERTGTSSLPQVFFNEAFVGGIDELKAMEASRELDERLKQVFEIDCTAMAPLPPVPQEEDNPLSENKDELAEVAQRLKEKVQIKDRLYKMHWFTRCFLGSEAVGILAEDQNRSRQEAVELGRKLVSKFFFQHVMQENKFEDGNHFYRFLEHDPVVMTYCFNFKGKIIELEPKKAQEMGTSLWRITLAIFEQYVAEDGKHVDYQGISMSEEFRRYLTLTHQLQRVDLLETSREEKLAFFINLYNAMVVHAVIVLGHPVGPLDRRKFFGDFQYLIGGDPYSLSAIENGVLRANQRPPYNFIKAFGPKDNRLKVSLLEPLPLVHFALNRATRSSPALKLFTPANIDAELHFAARSFFRDGGILIDVETKTVSLNKIMNWYSADFGKTESEILKGIVDYLEPAKAEDLIHLLEGDIKIVYQPYDWSPNI